MKAFLKRMTVDNIADLLPGDLVCFWLTIERATSIVEDDCCEFDDLELYDRKFDTTSLVVSVWKREPLAVTYLPAVTLTVMRGGAAPNPCACVLDVNFRAMATDVNDVTPMSKNHMVVWSEE